jgi:ABC-type multidrug transport system fused ATPase/permease subunit
MLYMMIPIWDNVKQMPKALRTAFSIFYLIFFLYLLTLVFAIPLPLPDYAIVIISGLGIFLFGFALLYGGIRELRLARQEARKPELYKYMEIYAGLALIFFACFVLFSIFYQNDILFEIVGIACGAIAIICLAPSVIHSVNTINKASVEAVVEAKRKREKEEQDQQHVLTTQQRETDHADQTVRQGKPDKVRAIIHLSIVAASLLALISSFIVFIISDNGKNVRYEIPAIIFSIAWLLWGVFAILRNQDKKHAAHETWHWYQQSSVIYTIAAMLFLLFYLMHLLFVNQNIVSNSTANLLNIIPLIIFVAAVFYTSNINGKDDHASI